MSEVGSCVIHIFPGRFYNTLIFGLELRFQILLVNCKSHFLELVCWWNPLSKSSQDWLCQVGGVCLCGLLSFVFDEFRGLVCHF